jgi:transcription initiation factor TFIIIB Brf1 subunit/transcription initiation factor TFIIB
MPTPQGTNRNQSVTGQTCPECKGRNVINDRVKGEYVCRDCGIVIGKGVSHQGR